jgi:hypothetical protein
LSAALLAMMIRSFVVARDEMGAWGDRAIKT